MAELVKLSRNGNSMTMVIPRGKFLQLGWKAGEQLALTVVGKRLVAVSMQDELDRLERENGDAVVASAGQVPLR